MVLILEEHGLAIPPVRVHRLDEATVREDRGVVVLRGAEPQGDLDLLEVLRGAIFRILLLPGAPLRTANVHPLD